MSSEPVELSSGEVQTTEESRKLSPDEITHSMRICLAVKNKISHQQEVLAWEITKTKEEILRFCFKLHTFHRKVTDPNSLFFLNCLESGISKSAPPLDKNWIDYYNDRLSKAIKYHRADKSRRKHLHVVDSNDKQEGSIEKICLELIKELLSNQHYILLLEEHFKKQFDENDKNHPIDYKRINLKNANSLTKELARSLEDLIKCFEVVYQFIEFSQINLKSCLKTGGIVCQFIEDSQSLQELKKSSKLKEGYVYKRTGGTGALNQQFFYICKYFRRLQKRWMFITKDGIGYTNSFLSKDVQKMIYFQHDPIVYATEEQTGYPDVIILRTKVEDLFFHTGSIKKKIEWSNAIKSAIKSYKEQKHHAENIGFTFKEQPGNKAKWYVDGHHYFQDIFNDLTKAKHRVIISDWWFCPHLFLRRPASKHPDSEIVEVLRKLVQNNPWIEIYIHMYREPKPLDLGSEDTEKTLSKDPLLMNKIHILRHPERGISGHKLLWAHHEKICVIDDRIAYLGGIDLCYGRYDTHQHKLVDDSPEGFMFPGPDFSNPRISEVIDMKKYSEDQLDRKQFPRMPWHDIALRIEGSSAQDVSLHFMDLVNWASRDSGNFRRKAKGVMSERLERVQVEPSAPSYEQELEKSEVIQEISESVEADNRAGDSFSVDSSSNCQILRSVGQWSYGWLKKEKSIQRTYLRLIQESKHFIYIENQFFISSTAGPEVKNKIAQALVDRIKRAFQEDSQDNKKPSFRVIVCMPLLPAFEGEVTENTAPVLKIQLYWEYMTIFKSKTSIFEQLKNAGINPEDYISFYGLRTHGLIKNDNNVKAVSEIVYIHSKLMIVDDDVAIIGSANINDRSMSGDHDSEIACYIKDTNLIDSTMNSKPMKKGRFAFTLRQEIFNEILGNDDPQNKCQKIDVRDPLSETFINQLKTTAKNNTLIYREVFKCYPDDKITKFSQIKENLGESKEETVRSYRTSMYHSHVDKIVGFIVEFPMKFLDDENLKPSIYSKEGVAPTELWV